MIRCKRSDGKQWRCHAMSMPDKTVCEKHYIQAKISRQRDMDESEETPKAYRTPSSVADSSKSRSEKMHNASAMTVNLNIQE
ncbi:putative transcription factor interactor and regulator C3H-WRC/GRF family [Helianthus annuus]|nr:putative transcription factor interactor and regulator C3H-WRC/GRF family [Helianthus annuus]